jgi:hypothetical protein
MTASLPVTSLVRWASTLWQCRELSRVYGLSRRQPRNGTTAHHGIGGDECLFDRLLCVSDEKRTETEENHAHNLALKRNKYEDMAEFPKICASHYSPASQSCQ